MGAVRACFVIALIAVTGVQAVVENQMTDDQFEHSEEMAKTKLTKPEYGMKVFVYYTDKKNRLPIWVPAVITGVSTMIDGPIEINVRYLDGSRFNSRVNLDHVVYRDNSVSYENWILNGYDPRTMLENGQPRITTGSSSRPFVVAPSMNTAFRGSSSSGGGAVKGSSSGGGAANGSSSGGGAAKGSLSGGGAAKGSSSGGGAAKGSSSGAAGGSSSGGGAAQKKRKVECGKTGKKEMDKESEWTVEDTLEEINVWLHESYNDYDKLILVVAELRVERDAAVDRAHQSDVRATAAEARIAAAEGLATAAEARVAAAEERAAAAVAELAHVNRSTRTRNAPVNTVSDHSACRDFKGMGGGK